MALPGGFQEAFDFLERVYKSVKALLGFKEQSEMLGLVNSTQSELFGLRAEHQAALRRISELEAELVQVKQWEEDKRRYKLHEVSPGTFVFRIDPVKQEGEPAHDLCPHCYQEAVKSILQRGAVAQQHDTLRCPRCAAVFLLDRIEAAGVTVSPGAQGRRRLIDV
jgi:superfamily II helicase